MKSVISGFCVATLCVSVFPRVLSDPVAGHRRKASEDVVIGLGMLSWSVVRRRFSRLVITRDKATGPPRPSELVSELCARAGIVNDPYQDQGCRCRSVRPMIRLHCAHPAKLMVLFAHFKL